MHICCCSPLPPGCHWLVQPDHLPWVGEGGKGPRSCWDSYVVWGLYTIGTTTSLFNAVNTCVRYVQYIRLKYVLMAFIRLKWYGCMWLYMWVCDVSLCLWNVEGKLQYISQCVGDTWIANQSLVTCICNLQSALYPHWTSITASGKLRTVTGTTLSS